MIVNPINDEECSTILRRACVGRLACARDNEPYVVPIYLAYEAGYVYVFSTFGQKIRWMRANPKVCLEIDEIANESEWATVIVTGRYEELVEPQYANERAHARKLLERQHYHWWLNAAAERRLESDDQLVDPLFFRVRVDSMTGLRAVAENTESTSTLGV